MKRSIFTLIGILLLTSCSSVRFENPPPKNKKAMLEMPSKLIGNYLDADGDTLTVTKSSFIFKKDKEKHLSSDRVELKKYKDFYVLSCKEMLHGDKESSLQGWEVILVEMVNDDVLLCYSINTAKTQQEEEIIKKLEDILSIEKLLDVRDEVYFLINPNNAEFKEILNSDIFTFVLEFNRIKKQSS